MSKLIMQGSSLGTDTRPTWMGSGLNFNDNMHRKERKAISNSVRGDRASARQGDGLFFSEVPISAQNGSGSGKSKKMVRLNLSTADAMRQQGRGLFFS